MKTLTKSILTLSIISLLLVGCDPKKDDKNAEKKPTTIEEIQAEKGKPARVVKAGTAKLTDVRKFSGTIEGLRQNKAISKMGDPLAKIYIQVGSEVRKDQVLAEYLFTGDNTGYQQAQEQVALQEKSLERLRSVYEKGGVSQQDIDQLETQIKIAKMNMETARRATLILAPEAGVVTELNYQVGQAPGVGGVLCTIAKLDQVILKLNITSQDIGFFKKGTTASININGKKIDGTVTLVPLAANPQTRFFPVEVTFDNKDRDLLPGMFITAEVDAREIEGIIVPNEAIFYRNGINSIWTVTPEGKAKRNIVKLGVQTNNDVQVLEGIEAGETIMVEGQSRMNDGDKVLIVE